jgi:hypothetical protein
MSETGRLPHFLIIGFMKCGTTSVSAWLSARPDVFISNPKEPGFFSHDERWARGLDWYKQLFSAALPGQLAGEATQAYTHEDRSATTAKRIEEVLPNAKLVCVLRHPVERLRSQYRHWRLTGRESRPISEALLVPGNPYIARSQYYECLRPYIDRFSRDQIHLARIDDLLDPAGTGWFDLLAFLDLSPAPHRGEARNVSEQWRVQTSIAKLIPETLRRSRARLPAPIRRVARRLLTRHPEDLQDVIVESSQPIDSDTIEPIWADLRKLEGWLRHGLGWP